MMLIRFLIMVPNLVVGISLTICRNALFGWTCIQGVAERNAVQYFITTTTLLEGGGTTRNFIEDVYHALCFFCGLLAGCGIPHSPPRCYISRPSV